MKQSYLTPAQIRRRIRALSNWPEVANSPDIDIEDAATFISREQRVTRPRATLPRELFQRAVA